MHGGLKIDDRYHIGRSSRHSFLHWLGSLNLLLLKDLPIMGLMIAEKLVIVDRLSVPSMRGGGFIVPISALAFVIALSLS